MLTLSGFSASNYYNKVKQEYRHLVLDSTVDKKLQNVYFMRHSLK